MWFECRNCKHRWEKPKINGLAEYQLNPNEIKSKCNKCGSTDVSWILHTQYPRYLFSWDEILRNDSGELIDFLRQNYSIDWVKTAKIEKIDNGRTKQGYQESKNTSKDC